ncbi:hypothetical protein C7S20_13220 [Christiangramia fulva]|uniref:STAS/SEC14 domain-containing protein n=1 Tax=Christiangramia fulva TaxID=2126553 RepID=A0A2R3Z7A9_9FLAO|nr:hypothetical protein [Christiangramia fulva]AVR46139.1 hypothetical protein C7S20_13220 [Christiangramia fulva]
MTSLKKIELDFANLQFFDEYVISRIKNDVLLEKNNVEILRKMCHDFYGFKKFVYIADRENDYNVNPIIYLTLLERNTLMGIAVVSRVISKLKTANFEKQFSPVAFELFQNLEEAKVWAQSLIHQE